VWLASKVKAQDGQDTHVTPSVMAQSCGVMVGMGSATVGTAHHVVPVGFQPSAAAGVVLDGLLSAPLVESGSLLVGEPRHVGEAVTRCLVLRDADRLVPTFRRWYLFGSLVRLHRATSR
jgi:hypothetical protein